MKLIMTIEFTPNITKDVLIAYAERLQGQMTTIYRSTPGICSEFIGITAKVE
jgi:hypothetical protein